MNATSILASAAEIPILTFLDKVCGDLKATPGKVDVTLELLALHLRTLKREGSTPEWKRTIAKCRAHPLRELLHQDPLTARAFAMSRGYQGDAELLDIIYASDYRPFVSAPVTALGESIFQHTIEAQAPSAVRERRYYLATQIDTCCASFSSAHILSVACGHLRELEISRSVQTRSFGRFVGLDQDPATLAFVAHTWGHLGVEAKRASVKLFLSNAPPSERFNFIYVAGLYDYLDEALAQRITEKLFDMLRPGGRLLIGNYTPDTDDAGYMEAYMGWHLIYRDAQAMHRLAATISASRISDVGIVPDSTGAVIYLDLRANGDDRIRNSFKNRLRRLTQPP